MKISKGEICYNCFKEGGDNDQKVQKAVNYIENLINAQGYVSLDESQIFLLVKRSKKLLHYYTDRIRKFKSWDVLEQKCDFLQHDFDFEIQTVPFRSIQKVLKKKRGPKKKHFDQQRRTSKWKEVKKITETAKFNLDLLLNSALIVAQSQKNRSCVFALKKLLGKKKQDFSRLNQQVRKATKDEAFEFHLTNRFSQRQYKNIHAFTKSHGVDLLPTYNFLLSVKEMCYPQGIYVDGLGAYVSVKNMVIHIIHRLFEFLKSDIVSKMNMDHDEWNISLMYGMDGSSGFSHYNLKMADFQDTDEHVFAVSCVPLTIESKSFGKLWDNPSPSSVRFCRPLRILFSKETKDLTLKIHEEIKDEIDNMEKYTFPLFEGSDKTISVQSTFHLCMIDGKTMVTISGARSVQSCSICDMPPSEFNVKENWESTKFIPKEGRLCYGLSPLHLYIRIFEALLHVAYLKVVKKSRKGQCPQVLENKVIIKKRFSDLMHLKVDSVNPQGGSTNNGNTSRKCFANIDLFAECLGFDAREKEIITMFRNILLTISSQLAIDPEKFHNYCYLVYCKWFELFPWQPMTPTVHKVLVHSSQIIRASPFPVGMLTEESAESRNKFFKYDRKYRSRQSNRIENLTDILNNALQMSDPYFSSKSFKSRKLKKKSVLPQEVIQLLDLNNINLSEFQLMNENDIIQNYNDEIEEYLDEEFLVQFSLEEETY